LASSLIVRKSRTSSNKLSRHGQTRARLR